MERGFFSASQNRYWQTTGDVPKKYIDKWPEDYVEVPVRPSVTHDWDGQVWVETQTAEEKQAQLEQGIKGELRRRIRREGFSLQDQVLGLRNPSTPDNKAMFARINALEAAANALKAQGPNIPENFKDDAHWP